MATSTLPRPQTSAREPEAASDSPGTWETLERVLGPLASLKLTVALFAMAIFIVFAGTLAQVDHDIWKVIDDYFRMKLTSPQDLLRSCYARIEFQIFFPKAFFPNPPQVPGWFPFPKGWLIGLAMFVNLAAAHAIRFKVQASGARLALGLGFLGLGMVTTWLVIASGSNKDGFQSVAALDWGTLWRFLQFALLGISAMSVAAYFLFVGGKRTELWLLLGLNILIIAGISWLAFFDGGALQDSSMRILWQLIKATFAGLVLLIGCFAVFKKRAGVVLLHGGIGLMMISEVIVGVWAVEAQMQIEEGQTARYVQDIRSVELAVVEPGSDDDQVTVVPQSFLAPGQTVRHEALPFDVRVEKFIQNSDLREAKPGEENPATEGAGLVQVPEAVRPGTGTDSEGRPDYASAYVKLTSKDGQADLGTYLVSLWLRPQPVRVGDKTYEISLRFKRMYKPYEMTLVDVRKDDYVGTDMARNYSSDIRLVDARHNVDHNVRIWMNNPLRYAGETFYQSSYHRDERTGKEYTTLQVVTNTGWMIPYVSCMIVAVGMLFHFSITLLRFLNRRAGVVTADAVGPPRMQGEPAADRAVSNPTRQRGEPAAERFSPEKPSRKQKPSPGADASASRVSLYVTAGVVGLGLLFLLSKAIPPRAKEGEMDLYRFGQLPIANEGRIQPVDTLARNSLMAITHMQTFKETVEKDKTRPQPAIKWLLDVMASPKSAESHKVFRIKHEQLLTTMGLEKRSGFRYSIDEFRGKIGELEKQARLAHGVPAEERSLYQAAVLELANSLRHYLLLQQSFATPPTKMTDVREEVDFVISAPQSIAELARMTNVPLAVPPQSAKEPWQPLAAVAVRNELQLMGKRRNAGSTQQLADQLVNQVADQMAKATGNQLNAGMRQNVASAVNMAISQVLGETQLNSQPNAAAQSWMAILRAYERGDAATFNAEVEKYQNMLNGVKLADFNHAKTRFESYFNHFSPFYWEMYLYAIAFFLAAFAWLGWSVPLNRAAFWLIAVTLVAHTLALAARIYISGRPPVTNLYSSAVFIGWGAVVFGLIFERIFKLGVGNVIASIAGGATLLIAHFLAGDGDTFKVLVAVLDTNFWLATHVVLITLGYATTFVAGLLGLIYVLLGVFTPALKPQVGKDLSRMIYGTLCFATFFSFVGTVLGGLWADDSWGRFWGWDPKENGALIIVLWNALVLHARWGGMAKDRGVAVLAVVGNIVTSWSWFGVNQLGAGLHSYGFTSGVALTLLLFVISQIVVIGLGCLPKMLWGSARSFAGQG